MPVAAASARAAAIRIGLADAGLVSPVRLFPVPEHAILGDVGLLGALAVGIAGGPTAWLLTACVYGAEDGFTWVFERVHLHWMWWPAIGGLVVGVGGLLDPRALGVGYDSIRAELAGQIGRRVSWRSSASSSRSGHWRWVRARAAAFPRHSCSGAAPSAD